MIMGTVGRYTRVLRVPRGVNANHPFQQRFRQINCRAIVHEYLMSAIVYSSGAVFAAVKKTSVKLDKLTKLVG